jgi:predicted nucleic acid-binding protein
VHVPHIVDIEVAQALRRYAHDGELDAADVAVALEDLRSLDLERHTHEPLLDRVWALRRNLSAYDAVYVALAEVLDTVVLTCDGRFARAPSAGRRVELVKRTN